MARRRSRLHQRLGQLLDWEALAQHLGSPVSAKQDQSPRLGNQDLHSRLCSLALARRRSQLLEHHRCSSLASRALARHPHQHSEHHHSLVVLAVAARRLRRPRSKSSQVRSLRLPVRPTALPRQPNSSSSSSLVALESRHLSALTPTTRVHSPQHQIHSLRRPMHSEPTIHNKRRAQDSVDLRSQDKPDRVLSDSPHSHPRIHLVERHSHLQAGLATAVRSRLPLALDNQRNQPQVEIQSLTTRTMKVIWERS